MTPDLAAGILQTGSSTLLGYDSTSIRAEESLYDLAQWVRTQDDLSIVLQNMSGAQFASAYQTGYRDGVDEGLWSAFCQRFTVHLAHFGHALYVLISPSRDNNNFFRFSCRDT